MAVIKLAKPLKLHGAGRWNPAFQPKDQLRPAKIKSQKGSGLKKVYLKPKCGNMIMLSGDSSKKPKKKVLCVKKKCCTKKMSSNKKVLKSSGHLNDKVRQWLKNNESEYPSVRSDQENPESIENPACGIDCGEVMQALDHGEENCMNTLSQQSLTSNVTLLRGSVDNNIINVCAAALPEQKELRPAVETLYLNSKQNHPNASTEIKGKLPTPPLASDINSSFPSSAIMSNNKHLDSLNHAQKGSQSDISLENNLSVLDSRRPTGITVEESTLQSHLHPCKHLKTSKRAYKTAFRKYLLKNSHNGCLMASRKFLKRQLLLSRKNKRSTGKIGHVRAVCSDSPITSSAGGGQVAISVKNLDTQLDDSVPLEVKVPRKLVSSIFSQNSDENCLANEEQEYFIIPRRKKTAYKFKSPSTGSKIKNGISFSVEPYGKPNVSCQSSNITREEVEMTNTLSAERKTSTSNRDVCYIFAMLDKEKEQEQAVCKISPQLKSSHLLEELGSVLTMISADEDITCLQKLVSLREPLRSETPNAPTMKDAWTSPASFPCTTADKGCQWVAEPTRPKQVSSNGGTPASHQEEAVGTGQVPDSKVDLKNRNLNSTSKVIISQALITFASELSILTNMSIRLLSWCSGTVKSKIDSHSCGDEFEGLLCHCHDKVSIVMECLSELDAKQILNIDENELNRFWLLHNAMSCILLANRYLHCYSSSDSFNELLVSLMMTCSKMILPRGKINIRRWILTMSMISDICSKLRSYDYLPDACNCYDYLDSFKQDRYCRLCKVNGFFEIMCKDDEILSSKVMKEVSNLQKPNIPTNTSVLEQLFPRFHHFLNEVESWSEEEFKAAFLKHSVVRFSCNIDSGLYPCDEHMSVITCNCFSPSRVLDAQLLLGDVAHGSCNSINSLPENRHNICPANKPSLEETSSPENGEDKSGDLKVKYAQTISHEKSCNNTDHVHENSDIDTFTVHVGSGGCQIQLGNESVSKDQDATCDKSSDTNVEFGGGESTASSQDYTLKIDTLSETEQDKLRPKLQFPVNDCPNSEDKLRDVTENLGDNSGSSSNKTESTVIMRTNCEYLKKNADNPLVNESSCIDYSPLNVKQARCNIEKSLFSHGVSSSNKKFEPKTQGFVEQGIIDDSRQSFISESSKPETDFTESSRTLVKRFSLCANNGSASENADDAAPSEEEQDNQDSSVIVLSSPGRSLKSSSGESLSEQPHCSKPTVSLSPGLCSDKESYFKNSMDTSGDTVIMEENRKTTAAREFEVGSSFDIGSESSKICQNADQNQSQESINERSSSVLTLSDTETQGSTLDIVSTNNSHEADSNVPNGVNRDKLDSKLALRKILPHPCCLQLVRRHRICPHKGSHLMCTISQEAEYIECSRNCHAGGDEDDCIIEESHKRSKVHVERGRSELSVPKTNHAKNHESPINSDLKNDSQETCQLTSNQVIGSKGTGKEMKRHQDKKDNNQEHSSNQFAKKMESSRLRNQLLSQKKRCIGYEGFASDLETSCDPTILTQHETDSCGAKERLNKKVRFGGSDVHGNSAFRKEETFHGKSIAEKPKSKLLQDCSSLQKDDIIETLTVKNEKNSAMISDSLYEANLSLNKQEISSRNQRKEDKQTDGTEAKAKNLKSAMKKNPSISKFDNLNIIAVHDHGSKNSKIRCSKEGDRREAKHIFFSDVSVVSTSEQMALVRTPQKKHRRTENLEVEDTHTQLLKQEEDVDIAEVKVKKRLKHSNVIEDANNAETKKKRKVACDDDSNHVDVSCGKKMCASVLQDNISNAKTDNKEGSNSQEIQYDAAINMDEARSRKKKKKSKSRCVEECAADNIDCAKIKKKKSSKNSNDHMLVPDLAECANTKKKKSSKSSGNQ